MVALVAGPAVSVETEREQPEALEALVQTSLSLARRQREPMSLVTTRLAAAAAALVRRLVAPQLSAVALAALVAGQEPTEQQIKAAAVAVAAQPMAALAARES